MSQEVVTVIWVGMDGGLEQDGSGGRNKGFSFWIEFIGGVYGDCLRNLVQGL